MSENKVYKTIEVTGTSSKGIEDAIETAISKASESVKNMRWFQVVDHRGHIDNGKVDAWQVTVKIGFHID